MKLYVPFLLKEHIKSAFKQNRKLLTKYLYLETCFSISVLCEEEINSISMKAQSFTDFVLLTCYCLKNGFIYRLPLILPCLILVESPPFSWFYYVKLKFLCEGILHAELKQAWSWFELKHFSPSIIDEKMPNVVSPILMPVVLFSSQKF